MSKRVTVAAVVLVLAGAGAFLFFFRMPPAPLYGPYTAQDLISFTDYPHADIPKVLTDEREVLRMLNQLGLPETLSVVSHSTEYAENGGLCHAAFHIVGRAAFDLMGMAAFEKCDATCFSGCYHGVLQGLALRTGSTELTDTMRSFCSARPTQFERDECFHGAGHGLMLYGNYDLSASLGECAALASGDARVLEWCDTGVFMENENSADTPTYTPDADIHFPCNTLSGASAKWCYVIQPDYFLARYGNDFSKARDECLKAPEAARGMCIWRLGQTKSFQTNTGSAETEAFCNTVPHAYFSDCIIGGVHQAIGYYGIQGSAEAAVRFCIGLAGDGAKRVCYGEYATRLPDLYTDKSARLGICSRFEAPYDASCAAAQ